RLHRRGAQVALEDPYERKFRLARISSAFLQTTLSLEPYGTLRHARANPECEQRRDNAHPEHDAPAEIRRRAEQRIDELKCGGRKEISPIPPTEHQPRRETAQPGWPVFEDERHAGRPFAAHAETEQRTNAEQHRIRRCKTA